MNDRNEEQSHAVNGVGRLRQEIEVRGCRIQVKDVLSKKTNKKEPWTFEEISGETLNEARTAVSVTLKVPEGTNKGTAVRFHRGDVIVVFPWSAKSMNGVQQLSADDYEILSRSQE